MIVRNFLKAECRIESCHEGVGLIKNVELYQRDDLLSGLKFVNYAEIPPGASIGHHKHENDEELYIILSGTGTMSVNGQSFTVEEGDVILNRPYCSHSLINLSDTVLRAVIFEAAIDAK